MIRRSRDGDVVQRHQVGGTRDFSGSAFLASSRGPVGPLFVLPVGAAGT